MTAVAAPLSGTPHFDGTAPQLTAESEASIYRHQRERMTAITNAVGVVIDE
jgi:hypothetical protein